MSGIATSRAHKEHVMYITGLSQKMWSLEIQLSPAALYIPAPNQLIGFNKDFHLEKIKRAQIPETKG